MSRYKGIAHGNYSGGIFGLIGAWGEHRKKEQADPEDRGLGAQTE
jgi:hypothetical protein